MMSLNKIRSILGAAALAAFAAAASLLASCNTTEAGGTYLKVHVDTSWHRYDSIQVLLDYGDGTAPKRLFGGKVDEASDLERVPAEGYEGGRITIVIRGYSGNTLARAENRDYDGATQATGGVVVVIAPKPDGKPDTVKTKDGLSLALGPKDTLVSIGDSVAFVATAGNDSGTIVEAAWDFDGDGKVDLTVVPEAGATALPAGSRYPDPGTYQASLIIKGSKGSTLSTSATVRVVMDKPMANAGPDIDALFSEDVTLTGKAKDSLGRVVKQEWQIGAAAFAATTDGKVTFKTPAAAGNVRAVFRVTDDDGQTAEDTAFVQVSALPDTSKDLLRLIVTPKDTLISIRDSVPFLAVATNDNGKIVKASWDLDGDDTVDVSQTADADSARFRSGFRFAAAGVYTPSVTIQGSRGASLQVSVTVRMVEDRPVAKAGTDIGAVTDSTVNLKGIADDTLGRITKQEWSINGGAFAVTADGKVSFKAPSVPGDIMAVFRVTDDDNLTDTDTVLIHVISPAVAALTQLTLQGCALAPDFNPDTLAYACAPAFGTASVTVTAKAQGSMTLNGKPLESDKASDPVALASGKATLTLAVSNQGAAKTYVVNVAAAAASGNNALTALTLSAGILSPKFDATTLGYSATVASSIASVTVTATLADTAATLTVESGAAFSGKPSSPVALGASVKSIPIVVTAQNGQVRTYTVSVTKQSANANLKTLVMSGGALDPDFAPATLAYTLKVSEALTTLNVTAGPEDTGKASMTLNGSPLAANTAKAASLAQAVTTVTVVVSAQDPAVRKTYVVTVSKVDDVAPAPPAVVPGTFITPDRPAWKWTAGGGGSGNFRYKLDNANLATGATLTTALTFAAPADLAPGSHTLYVQERDSADNWSASGSLAVVVSALTGIADYPLLGHPLDTLGGNPDAKLLRAPYLAQGIYVNGIYINNGTDGGSNATSPPLGFDTTNFSMEVDFKPEELPASVRTILMQGTSWRALAGVLDPDGKVSLLANNGVSVVKGTQGCAAGQWCTLKIEYAAGVAKVHLNGVLSASLTVKLAFGGGASLNVSSTNFSNGNVFKGNLRNLHVYSAGVKIAQFPLTADGKDVLGKKGVFSLSNAPFQTPGPGVSLAGVYPSSTTVGNEVTTGNLAAMNMADFRITGEFTISALPAGTMPVIIGGTSFRWLGAMIEPAGTLTLMYANSAMKTTTRAVSLNAKHTVSIRYSAASTIAAIYLDGVLAGTQAIAGGLPAGSDKNVSSTYYCCGTAFKGSLHRIRVESK